MRLCLSTVLAMSVAFGTVVPGSAQTSIAHSNQLPAPTAGQQGVDPKSEEIRRKVGKLGVGARITVIRRDGTEHYGTVSKIEPTTFEVAEVDLKQIVVERYSDVKKVRKGYGGKNYVSGKRPNPLWGWITVGALAGFLGIALAQMD